METNRNIILWWEIRRIPYNLILSLIGFISILAVVLIGNEFTEPGEDFVEPMLMFAGVIIYGLMANLCYTFGWVTEICGSHRTKAARSKMFLRGLYFSMGLTLLPAFILVAICLVFVFKHTI